MADRNRPQKHVARARMVLLSADRLDVATVARRAGISRPAVWRWQQRFAEAGVDGLLRDKTRKPGKAPSRARPCAPGGGADLRRAARRGRPTGPAAPWPRRSASRCARCSASGRPTSSSRTASAPSSARTIPSSPPSWRTIVGLYMDPPRARGRALDRREEPDPGARPHPAGAADQARQVRDDDPRLQAATARPRCSPPSTCSTAR